MISNDVLEINCGHWDSINCANVENINNFVGRKGEPDTLWSDCSMKLVNLQGGSKQRPECLYNLTVYVHSNEIISNQALHGDFYYFIIESKNSKYSPIESKKHFNGFT